MLRWVGTHRKLTIAQLKGEQPLGCFIFRPSDSRCQVHVIVDVTAVGFLAVPLAFLEPLGEPVEVSDELLEVPLYQWRLREHTYPQLWQQICGKYPKISLAQSQKL